MTRHSLRPFLASGALALLVAASGQPTPSWAAPPPHAPAHGWRKQHDPYYLGYTGKRWEKDYGILSGRCDRAAVGAVIGGVLGAAVGSQIGDGSGRQIAILVGTVLGAVVGAEIARSMTDADRACIAHGLELAPPGTRVRWSAPETGLEYALIPAGARPGRPECREFTLEVEGARRSTSRALGCRRADGSWDLHGV